MSWPAVGVRFLVFWTIGLGAPALIGQYLYHQSVPFGRFAHLTGTPVGNAMSWLALGAALTWTSSVFQLLSKPANPKGTDRGGGLRRTGFPWRPWCIVLTGTLTTCGLCLGGFLALLLLAGPG